MVTAPDFLKNLDFVPILNNHTPIEKFAKDLKISERFQKNFSKSIQACLCIKRDDLTPGFGNKTRKLEYLLADAKSQNSDCVITAGGPQSNHCRQTAQFARSLGLDTHLVFGTKTGERDFPMVGNPFIDELFSAKIHTCKKPDRANAMIRLQEELRFQGKRPYVIPVGGSNHLGALAYAKAFYEMLEQSRSIGVAFDKIIFATSSGGTHAGLVIGSKLANWSGKIIGISIDQVPDNEEPDEESKYVSFMTSIANLAMEKIGLEPTISTGDFNVNYSYLQDGYGVVGDIDRLGVYTLANHGILSGPVYSGRAFGALVDMYFKGEISPNDNVLFWHTGGVGELDVYREDLLAQ